MGYISSRPQSLAVDVQGLNSLKLSAGKNDPQAIKQAAKEFESLFMREVIKSMRQATMRSGMLDSQAGELGQDLFDQQLSQALSGIPGGLGDAIVRQLTQQMTGVQKAPTPDMKSPVVKALPPTTVEKVNSTSPKQATAPSAFVSQHKEIAQEVSRSSGIPASFMLGQAGLETGWGKHEIRHKDGSNAHNLFGIKAGPDWKGRVAEVTTTEYIQGQPVKVVAKFRAYENYRDSFADYARLISGSNRYARAMSNTHDAHAFTQSIQKSGYATDPLYASKLSRAIEMSSRAMTLQA